MLSAGASGGTVAGPATLPQNSGSIGAWKPLPSCRVEAAVVAHMLLFM